MIFGGSSIDGESFLYIGRTQDTFGSIVEVRRGRFPNPQQSGLPYVIVCKVHHPVQN